MSHRVLQNQLYRPGTHTHMYIYMSVFMDTKTLGRIKVRPNTKINIHFIKRNYKKQIQCTNTI